MSLEILRAGRSKLCRRSKEIRGYLAVVGAESSHAQHRLSNVEAVTLLQVSVALHKQWGKQVRCIHVCLALYLCFKHMHERKRCRLGQLVRPHYPEYHCITNWCVCYEKQERCYAPT